MAYCTRIDVSYNEMQVHRKRILRNLGEAERGIPRFSVVARPLSSTANYTSRAIIVESKHPGLKYRIDGSWRPVHRLIANFVVAEEPSAKSRVAGASSMQRRAPASSLSIGESLFTRISFSLSFFVSALQRTKGCE